MAADVSPRHKPEAESSAALSPTQPLKFIDLFCGIGGFRIAFQKAGGECVFSSDWNEMAQITYEANFDERPHGDIHSVPDNAIPPHNILCAGFPCQPFSIAGVSKKLSLGKKHGFEDKEQGNLFFKLADLIDHAPNYGLNRCLQRCSERNAISGNTASSGKCNGSPS